MKSLNLLLIILCFVSLSYSVNDYEIHIAGNNLDCNLNTNGTTTHYKIRTSDKLSGDYVNTFTLNCNSTMQSLEVELYDVNTRVYYNYLENVSAFIYDDVKSQSRLYETFIYVRGSFGTSNQCILSLDTTKKTYTFNSKSRLKDKFMTGIFSQEISFSCQSNLDHVQVIIDDRYIKYEVYDNSYINLSTLTLNVGNLDLKSKPVHDPVYIYPRVDIDEMFQILYSLLIEAFK